MAIKKTPAARGERATKSFSRGMTSRNEAAGIEATFRPEGTDRRPVQKTTMDFDKALYRALKLHSVMTNRSVRDLVHEYVRAGLAAEGVEVDAPHAAGEQ